jgi:hypothetical protein
LIRCSLQLFKGEEDVEVIYIRLRGEHLSLTDVNLQYLVSPHFEEIWPVGLKGLNVFREKSKLTEHLQETMKIHNFNSIGYISLLQKADFSVANLNSLEFQRNIFLDLPYLLFILSIFSLGQTIGNKASEEILKHKLMFSLLL